eukprot:gene7122-10976_t
MLVNDRFRVSYCTPPAPAAGFGAENLLEATDAAHFSSGSGVGHLVLFECKDLPEAGRGPVTVTDLVVRAPFRGFGEPVRSGRAWRLYGAAAAWAKQAELLRAVASSDSADSSAEAVAPGLPKLPPAAPFETDQFLQTAVSFAGDPEGDAQPTAAVAVYFASTHGVGDNVDVTFVALVGRPWPATAAENPAAAAAAAAAVVHSLLRVRIDPANCAARVFPFGEVAHYIGAMPLCLAVSSGSDDLVNTLRQAMAVLAESNALVDGDEAIL